VPYYIIPFNVKAGNGHQNQVDNDGRFLVDIFSEDMNMDLMEVKQETDYFIYDAKGEFSNKSAGGQWKYPTWPNNPQVKIHCNRLLWVL
jgi:hypothetical protein